jgi:hypothetical protein
VIRPGYWKCRARKSAHWLSLELELIDQSWQSGSTLATSIHYWATVGKGKIRSCLPSSNKGGTAFRRCAEMSTQVGDCSWKGGGTSQARD